MFGNDTDSVLEAAAALVNTEDGASASGEDELVTEAQVARFFHAQAYSGSLLQTREELDALRRLRAELRQLFGESRDEVAEHVNRILLEARAMPRLVRHDALDWHLHAVPDEAPFALRIRVETAMALLDLVRGDEVSRLKTCAADDCTAVLVDLSKNRSKRFCDVGNCGNRANVTAYRARKAAAEAS